MATEMGEYLVGAYLKLQLNCDFVDYNVRPPGGGLEGLNELDVVGIDFQGNIAYLCEVMTHIRGLLYKSNQETVDRVKKKFQKQKVYARKYLSQFQPVFMFWSPYVPKGYQTENLAEVGGLELIINDSYKGRVLELIKKAEEEKQDTGNPMFRVLQILGVLKVFEDYSTTS